MILAEQIPDWVVMFVCTLAFLTFGPTWAGRAFARGMKAYKKEMDRDPR